MSSGITRMQSSLVVALEDLHGRIAQATMLVAEDELDWQPAPGVPSIRMLVLAAVEEERRWMNTVAENALPAPQVPSAPPPELHPGDHPLFQLGSVGQYSQVVLTNLLPLEWTGPCEVEGRQVSVAECVLAILQGLARVLGEIEVVASLWRANRKEQPHGG
jgi:hypothetical protein